MTEQINTGPEHGTSTEDDPFSFENMPMMNFIMQARIYDVLMALLTEANKDLARQLLELHASGAMMGPSPAFSGNFVTDSLNAIDENDGDNSE